MKEKILVVTRYLGDWYSNYETGRQIAIPFSNISYFEDGKYLGGFSREDLQSIEDSHIRELAINNKYLGTHIYLKTPLGEDSEIYVLESFDECLAQLKN